MIAVAIALIVGVLVGWTFDPSIALLALAIGAVADAIRASRPKDWTLVQRVDALSDAYAKGYRDAKDEDAG